MHSHFVIELRGNILYTRRFVTNAFHLQIFHALGDALLAVRQLVNDQGVDIESDAIWVWESSPKDTKVAWHFSGWHYRGCNEIAGIPDGTLPGEDKPLIEQLGEDY